MLIRLLCTIVHNSTIVSYPDPPSTLQEESGFETKFYLAYTASQQALQFTGANIDLIHETISHYVIHFRMAKVHECPLAAVYTAVSGEA